jgi:hypothetical protein
MGIARWGLLAVALATVGACLDPVPEAPAEGTTDVTTIDGKRSDNSLAPGDRRVWMFDGAMKPGIDPRFGKPKVKAAKKISYRFGSSQEITMTATNEDDGGKPSQADISIPIADIPVNGPADHYYKGWLEGTVKDSDNDAIGFCGNGGFEKGSFHTQLQLAFLKGNQNLALCYCNICPAKDGHDVSCATDQWQTPTDDPPKVSDDGACKAPGATTHVVVTLEAVAKGDKNVHHHGTAVFKKVVVARCKNNGDCSGLAPGDYGQ